jgi:hypothetical protein
MREGAADVDLPMSLAVRFGLLGLDAAQDYALLRAERKMKENFFVAVNDVLPEGWPDFLSGVS